jgi:hypothetical protein
MATTHPHEPEPRDDRWSAERTQDAAALVERLGAGGVAWLDLFLADYVFAGEPLDLVMAEARRLAKLPTRPATSSAFDDD